MSTKPKAKKPDNYGSFSWMGKSLFMWFAKPSFQAQQRFDRQTRELKIWSSTVWNIQKARLAISSIFRRADDIDKAFCKSIERMISKGMLHKVPHQAYADYLTIKAVQSSKKESK